MKIFVLSSEECRNKNLNNGDCFVIDNGKKLVIYDCGCYDYADWIMNYMDAHNYEKVTVVLSHNDDDHFKGLERLLRYNKVDIIHTVLLLKYKEELLNIIDDGRKNRKSIGNQIIHIYDNVAELSGVPLKDAFINIYVADGVTIVGPGEEYVLKAAAKGLDTTVGDTIDNVTITNATSIHLEVCANGKKVLLTGDSSFESVMMENLNEYDYIQLPHHGNAEIAEKIINELGNMHDVTYIVSDNTGDSNGGSDKLKGYGCDIRNTKNDGLIKLQL